MNARGAMTSLGCFRLRLGTSNGSNRAFVPRKLFSSTSGHYFPRREIPGHGQNFSLANGRSSHPSFAEQFIQPSFIRPTLVSLLLSLRYLCIDLVSLRSDYLGLRTTLLARPPIEIHNSGKRSWVLGNGGEVLRFLEVPSFKELVYSISSR